MFKRKARSRFWAAKSRRGPRKIQRQAESSVCVSARPQRTDSTQTGALRGMTGREKQETRAPVVVYAAGIREEERANAAVGEGSSSPGRRALCWHSA